MDLEQDPADTVNEDDVKRFTLYAAELEAMGLEYGDTPARHRSETGVDDWTASGLPVPPALRVAQGWRPIGIINEPGITIGVDVSATGPTGIAVHRAALGGLRMEDLT